MGLFLLCSGNLGPHEPKEAALDLKKPVTNNGPTTLVLVIGVGVGVGPLSNSVDDCYKLGTEPN